MCSFTKSLNFARLLRFIDSFNNFICSRTISTSAKSPASKIDYIRECLRRHSLQNEDGWCFFKLPRCPHKDQPKNELVSSRSHNAYNPFFISKTTGSFVCFHCMKTGDLDEFLTMARIGCTKTHNVGAKTQRMCPKSAAASADFAYRSQWENAEIITHDGNHPQIDRILAENPILKLLTIDTLIRWRMRIDKSSDPNRILIPSVLPDKSTVEVTSLNAITSPPPVPTIGLQTFTNFRQSDVIITETVLDALCAFQGTAGKPTIAISDEDAIQLNVPDYVMAILEKFKRIYIWPSSKSENFKEIGLIRLAKELGQNRCMIVNPIHSPRECLQYQYSFKEALSSAFSLICDDLLKFDKIRHAVKHELEFSEKFKGIQWYRFSALNSILKGHRPGELTILTGNTGCGKTTFLSEYSLDLCAAKGVPTLWGSFEIHNHRLAKTMLIQFAGGLQRLRNNNFDKFADAFSQLNMYFMSFHGAEDMRRVSSAMAAAVIGHGIKHVVIDNLQFMIGMEYSNADRFYKQDKVIQMLRKFCTVYHCHITLVIHPRKECLGEGERLSIQSIFGSAKASQEADNVIIIQQEVKVSKGGIVKSNDTKYLDIVKNRFDGDLGRIPILFNKDQLSFNCVTSISNNSFEDEYER